MSVSFFAPVYVGIYTCKTFVCSYIFDAMDFVVKKKFDRYNAMSKQE